MSDRSLIASIAANERWAKVEDRSAETASARRAFEARFPNERPATSAVIVPGASPIRRPKAPIQRI